MYTALRAASRTLRALLLSTFQSDADLAPFFGGAGALRVSLRTPQEMSDEGVEGLSVWLYRVVRDEDRLNDPELLDVNDHRRPPPLPLRLHYLMTPVINADNDDGSETEQLILGKLLQALNDRPTLRGSDLVDFTDPRTELYVRLETLGLQDISQVWQALEGSYQLSVSYEVSLVNISPALEPYRPGRVRVSMPEYGTIIGTGD